MIDVMLSKATVGMLVAELLGRKDEKNDPLFMCKSIVLSNGQIQLLAIIPNVLVLSVIEEEE